MECDEEGEIVWMSEAARARLGELRHLLEGVAEAPAAEMRRYLRESRPGDVFSLRAAGWRRGVPVRFSCLLRRPQGVILTAEVRERAADRMAGIGEGLSPIESRLLQNYFRLLRAQQGLDSRLERGRRNGGMVLIEQLDRERARLGRELHTGAEQSLIAIKQQVELIEKKAPDLPLEIRGYLETILSLARDAGSEVRAVSHRLHPPDWQALGLTDALRNLWNNSGISETFQGTLTLGPLVAEPSHPVRVAIYRIAQEGLSNAIRHAGATELALTLEESPGWLLLRLEDNGHGFDVKAPADAKGIGLHSIRDQVEMLGGDMQIRSGSGGTKLEVRIPLEPGND